MISLDEEIRKEKQKNRNHHEQRDHKDHRGRYEDSHHRNQHAYRRNFDDREKDRERYQRQPQRTLLKITQLHYSFTKEQLQELCEKYGKVKTCRIDWDKMGRSNQTATVDYFSKEEAEKAVKQLDNFVIEGQAMKVEISSNNFSIPAKRHDIQKNHGNKFRNFNRYGRKQ